jgi:hypothetical protein
MTIRLRWFAAAFAFIALTGPAAADIYKWVDAQGRTHFGNTPPPGQKAERVNGQTATPDAPPPQQSKQNWQEQLELSNQRHQQTREKEQAAAQKEQEDRERCTSARSRVDFLERGGARYRIDEQGDRQYLDDAQRQAEIELARQHVTAYCR